MADTAPTNQDVQDCVGLRGTVAFHRINLLGLIHSIVAPVRIGWKEIKKIENPHIQMTTFARRRNGLFKKAYELSVLCDIDISVLIFDTKNKCHVVRILALSLSPFLLSTH
ncbi:hypothetical protein PCK1_002260 [Pneumocystis canis]|nr:hypothetical protein PCK1_002260 [Pneumocystis canis]